MQAILTRMAGALSIRSVCLAALLVAGCATAPATPELREPATPTRESLDKFAEAEFHLLGGDLNAAQKLYEEILEQHPDSPHVMHQLAGLHLRRGEPELTIDYARRAAGYATRLQPNLLALEASALDRLGRLEESLVAFRRALALSPNNALIHFNIGVTLLNNAAADKAVGHFRQAVGLDPLHASAHYALGQVYLRRGQRLPALLALLRGLTLDGDSERAGQAAMTVVELVESSVQREGDGGAEKIVLAASRQRLEDGDFSAIELMLSLSQLQLQDDAVAELPRFQLVGQSLKAVFDGLNSKLTGAPEHGFAWHYYAPYFASIGTQLRAETFALFALRAAEMPGGREQLVARRDEIGEFLRWQKDYDWPADPPH